MLFGGAGEVDLRRDVGTVALDPGGEVSAVACAASEGR